MTRGPEGSAVRSNIRPMVQERRRRSGRDRGGGREFGRSGSKSAVRRASRRLCFGPDLPEPGTRVGPIEGALPRAWRRRVPVRPRVGRVLACGWWSRRRNHGDEAAQAALTDGGRRPRVRCVQQHAERLRRRRRGRVRGHRHAGWREPPDPGRRAGQVQRRDGPHRPARRRRLEPGPLRGPPVPLQEHGRLARRLHRERPRGRRLRAGLPEPRPEGLQLHHRHVVRLHGPDGDGRRGIPRHHVPPPDRLQVERQELRQLLRRGRGLQVPRRDARRVAGEDGRATRRSATWRPSRSPRSSASATRSCAASRSPARSARWTSGSSTPGTTR